MTLSKAALLRLTVPAILATWLAAEASTAGSRDKVSATLRSDRSNATTVRVSFRDGLLSVEAQEGTWMQVLNEISEQTGIRFHHSLPFAGSVTVSFASLPVTQAIERLFGPEADFVFRCDAMAYSSASLPKEVWILGNVRDDRAAAAQQGPRPSESTSRTDMRGQAVNEPDGSTAAAQVEFNRLMEMTKSSKGTTRVEALSILAESDMGDQEAIRYDLAAALEEQEPEVRSLAVQALASHGGPEAMNHLSQALRDPAPSVRIMAVESAPPKGEGLAVLREAVADTDELVRTIARDRLQEAESQRAD